MGECADDLREIIWDSRLQEEKWYKKHPFTPFDKKE
jgi:hypothetical protein